MQNSDSRSPGDASKNRKERDKILRSLGFITKEQQEKFLKEQESRFLKEEKSTTIQPGLFSHLTITEDQALGIIMMYKNYGGAARKIPGKIIPLLAESYKNYPKKLAGIGVGHIVQPRNIIGLVNPEGTYGVVHAEQPYIHYPLLSSWLKEGKYIEQITKSLVDDFTLPLLEHANPDGSLEISMDLSLNNFFFDPEFGVWGFDLFPPLMRKELTIAKEAGFDEFNPHVNLDPGELEYRHFTAAGTIHSLLQRGVYRLLKEFFPTESKVLQPNEEIQSNLVQLKKFFSEDHRRQKFALRKRISAARRFLISAYEELAPYMEKYFSELHSYGKESAQMLALTPFSVYKDKFLP